MNQTTTTDAWTFEKWDVIRDDNGRLWHITGRWTDEDTDRRQYFVYDMTHTSGEYRDAEWVEEHGEATDYHIEGTKPAVKIGYRVNGMLVGPLEAPEKLDRDREREKGCIHDLGPCSNCGEEDSQEIDIVTTPSESDEENTTWCRTCGHMETHS